MIHKEKTPPGGWYFNEGKIIIKSDSMDNLILAVTAHRVNNGKPLGRPAEEIEEQIEGRLKHVDIS